MTQRNSIHNLEGAAVNDVEGNRTSLPISVQQAVLLVVLQAAQFSFMHWALSLAIVFKPPVDEWVLSGLPLDRPPQSLGRLLRQRAGIAIPCRHRCVCYDGA